MQTEWSRLETEVVWTATWRETNADFELPSKNTTYQLCSKVTQVLFMSGQGVLQL